jgi:hypothetical protein
MRIPDYPNVQGVKYLNHWISKTSRVEKAHKDAFENELEDSIHKRISAVKMKIEKETQKKHQSLLGESQELDEMQLAIDHLFSEYEINKSEAEIYLDEKILDNGNQFSSWG